MCLRVSNIPREGGSVTLVSKQVVSLDQSCIWTKVSCVVRGSADFKVKIDLLPGQNDYRNKNIRYFDAKTKII